MRIKLLLSIIFLASFKLVNAQGTTSWVYNFKNGTAATISSSGTSSTTSETFLPAPTSGIARVFLPAPTGNPALISSYTLAPNNNTLTHTPSTSVSKLSVYNVSGASAIVTAAFTVQFGRVSGTSLPTGVSYIFSMGNRGSSPNLYDNGTSLTNASSAGGNVFNAIRFNYQATDNYVLSFRQSANTNTSGSSTYPNLGGFVPSTNTVLFSTQATLSNDVPYRVEVYSNNSPDVKNYTKGGTVYIVAVACYHVWVTNLNTSVETRYSVSTNVFDIPKSIETGATSDLSIASGATLNSFLIQSSGNTSNLGNVIISRGIQLAYDFTTLPVSFTSFSGSFRNQEAALSWQTASELNNDYFTLLRASDDKDFQEIGKIYGKGNTNKLSNYNFTDRNPLLGNNYYKLTQVDKDGTATTYDKVVLVKSSLSDADFSINTNDGNSLNIKVIANQNTTGTLVIFNTSGQKVLESKIVLNKGVNQFNYDSSLFKSGMYITRVIADGLQLNKKFVKN